MGLSHAFGDSGAEPSPNLASDAAAIDGKTASTVFSRNLHVAPALLRKVKSVAIFLARALVSGIACETGAVRF